MSPLVNVIEKGQATPSIMESAPRSIPQKQRFVTGGKFVGKFMSSESTVTGTIIGTGGIAIITVEGKVCDCPSPTLDAAKSAAPKTTATIAMRATGLSRRHRNATAFNVGNKKERHKKQTTATKTQTSPNVTNPHSTGALSGREHRTSCRLGAVTMSG
jgi:hypothetical protein